MGIFNDFSRCSISHMANLQHSSLIHGDRQSSLTGAGGGSQSFGGGGEAGEAEGLDMEQVQQRTKRQGTHLVMLAAGQSVCLGPAGRANSLPSIRERCSRKGLIDMPHAHRFASRRSLRRAVLARYPPTTTPVGGNWYKQVYQGCGWV